MRATCDKDNSDLSSLLSNHNESIHSGASVEGDHPIWLYALMKELQRQQRIQTQHVQHDHV